MGPQGLGSDAAARRDSDVQVRSIAMMLKYAEEPPKPLERHYRGTKNTLWSFR